MSTYRAYRLDACHRIKTGRWIEAGSELEAKRKASEAEDDRPEPRGMVPAMARSAPCRPYPRAVIAQVIPRT